MNDNALFAKLLASQDGVSPLLARRRAYRYLTHLRLVSERDKTDLKASGVMSDDTIVRLVRAMRVAGLAPITEAKTLAEICGDLGIADGADLTRLVWTLNSGHSRTHSAASDRWHNLTVGAKALLTTTANAEAHLSVLREGGEAQVA
jgi:hypothetical protein